MARLVFECEDAEGYRVHFQTSEKEGKELIASYESSKKWLLENGFTPLKARAAKPKEKAKMAFDGLHCPRCNGAVWDNRSQKQSDPSRSRWPDFSCKNKESCGWAVWPGQYEVVQSAA
jgi:hypothetical protein